jgi:hypothetical protein
MHAMVIANLDPGSERAGLNAIGSVIGGSVDKPGVARDTASRKKQRLGRRW